MATVNPEKEEVIRKGQQAAKKLAAYLKVNKLDPNKDWSKHAEHGPVITKFQKRIKAGEEQAVDVTAAKNQKAKALKKPDIQPKKAKVTSAPLSYSYPDVDGKPMSPGQKKKYRQKMRDLTKSGVKGGEAEKKALDLVLNGKPVSEKPPKKAKVDKATSKEAKVKSAPEKAANSKKGKVAVPAKATKPKTKKVED